MWGHDRRITIAMQNCMAQCAVLGLAMCLFIERWESAPGALTRFGAERGQAATPFLSVMAL